MRIQRNGRRGLQRPGFRTVRGGSWRSRFDEEPVTPSASDVVCDDRLFGLLGEKAGEGKGRRRVRG